MSTDPQPLTHRSAGAPRDAHAGRDDVQHRPRRAARHARLRVAVRRHGRFVEEHVIDADGRCCDGDCS